MKYLCLIYTDEKALEARPQRELEQIRRACEAQCEELAKGGRLLASARLDRTDSAATVRLREGGVTVTDGPFAETREQLGGFYLIEARDLNEAIRIAAEIPPIVLGCIEVRPIRELGA